MGELVRLSDWRRLREAARGAAGRPRVTFYFDLVSPWTYLAAERVDRLFGGVRWRPVPGDVVAHALGAPADRGPEAELLAVRDRAAELRMPLVWPERWPEDAGRSAMRVAARAEAEGRAAPFVLAASRLAFCGGFELDDPETLAEAAAAAGLGLDAALVAAGDVALDGPMEEAARKLVAQGCAELPALRVGRTLFCGEGRLAEAAAAAAPGAQRPAARRRA